MHPDDLEQFEGSEADDDEGSLGDASVDEDDD